MNISPLRTLCLPWRRIPFKELIIFSTVLIVSGCNQLLYDKIQLGETSDAELKEILQDKYLQNQDWIGFSDIRLLPFRDTRFAVRTNEKGIVTAKVKRNIEITHFLLFVVDTLDIQVELLWDDENKTLTALNSSPQSGRSPWPPDTSKLDPAAMSKLQLFLAIEASLGPIWLEAIASIEKSLQTPMSPEQTPILYLLQLYLSTPPMPIVQGTKGNPGDEFGYGFISMLLNLGATVSLSDMIEDKDFITLMKKARELKFATSPEALRIRVGPWQVIKRDKNHYRLHYRHTSLNLP